MKPKKPKILIWFNLTFRPRPKGGLDILDFMAEPARKKFELHPNAWRRLGKWLINYADWAEKTKGYKP